MAITQQVTIKAAPDAVYNILTDSTKFTEMTGGRAADISQEEGGKVSLFGGGIEARNIELVPNKRVVQAWRAADWPDGLYSIISFNLDVEGSGTKISFAQSGHPDEAEEHLKSGWHQMYWNPMNEMVGS